MGALFYTYSFTPATKMESRQLFVTCIRCVMFCFLPEGTGDCLYEVQAGSPDGKGLWSLETADHVVTYKECKGFPGYTDPVSTIVDPRTVEKTGNLSPPKIGEGGGYVQSWKH